MINADFLQEGTLTGFRISGHAQYGEEGSDIVCAAVSSAAYMTANTITDVLQVKPLVLRVSDAEFFLRLSKEDAKACETLLRGFQLHMQQLGTQYAQYIHVGNARV